MEQLILWFSIMGFTFLFASMGASYVVYGRLKPRWLISYLLYLGVYAFFTIFNAYEFFSQVYLPTTSSVFNSLVFYFTLVIALILLLVVPRFIFSLLPSKPSLTRRIFPFVMEGLFLIMVVIAAVNRDLHLERIGSVLMNAYLGFVTLYGILRVRQVRERGHFGVVIPFLYLSCIFYFIVVLQTIFLPLFTSPVLYHHLSFFTAALICFLWGVITLFYLIVKNIRRQTAGSEVPTDAFVSRFGITPREREIITLLLYGKSNREIGEELFISQRTVEAHVYKIYRKCTVKNKLELVRQISSSP